MQRMSGCISDISRELEALGESDQDALDLWRESFNYERPHEALGMRCPGEVYIASERKYEGTPEDLDYPQMCSRRVSPKGLIRLEGQPLFPQHESGGLVRRTQANRGGFDGSLVWPPPAGPGGFGGEQFFSGGYPPEKNCK